MSQDTWNVFVAIALTILSLAVAFHRHKEGD